MDLIKSIFPGFFQYIRWSRFEVRLWHPSIASIAHHEPRAWRLTSVSKNTEASISHICIAFYRYARYTKFWIIASTRAFCFTLSHITFFLSTFCSVVTRYFYVFSSFFSFQFMYIIFGPVVAQGGDKLRVRSPLKVKKYLYKFIFSILRSGAKAKRGVKFRHSTRSASRIRRKV